MISSSSGTAEEAMSSDDGDYWSLRPNAPALGTALCAAAAIPQGAAREFRLGRGRSAFSMFVVRSHTGFHGYLNLCPHFSLPLNHEPDAFVFDGHIRCSQHFAEFRIEDGLCVSGACVDSHLITVPISENGCGELLIGPTATSD
jgi:nitrite reductase/ring-hydroxylating ferredoxin subunit